MPSPFPAESVLRNDLTSLLGKRLVPCFKRLSLECKKTDHFEPRHRHLEYEAIFVESGGYAASLNGEWLEIKPGDGVVVKVGDWHEDRCQKGVRFLGMSFTLGGDARDAAPPALFAAGVKPKGQVFKCKRQAIMPIVRGVFKEDALGDSFSYRLQDAYLLLFFWTMVRGLPQDSLNPALLDSACDSSFKSQLLRLFQESVGRSLDVADMAARFGMSESSFAHKCVEILGESPQKSFQKSKMEYAQYLLANTGLNVKEIARRASYSSEFAFSRAFAKHSGRSPSDWRKNYVCWVKN